MNYYILQDQAYSKWLEAQDMITLAEHKYNQNADKVEFDRQLVDALAVQDQAMELEKQAADEYTQYWRDKYQEELTQQRELAEQLVEERPV